MRPALVAAFAALGAITQHATAALHKEVLVGNDDQEKALQTLYASTGGDGWVCGASGKPMPDGCNATKTHADAQSKEWYLNACPSSMLNNAKVGTTPWLGVGQSYCDWFGVACDDDGNVVSVWLIDNNLVGDEGATWSLLPRLVCLDLSANKKLTGISSALARAPALQSLNLRHSGLRGNLTLPFGQLHELQYLDLASNELTGDVGVALAGLSPTMVHLDISDNGIFGRPPSWSASSQLAFLRVVSCLYFDYDTGLGDDFFVNATGLNYTSFRNTPVAGTLPTSLGLLSAATTIDLSNTLIHGEIADSIFTGLTSLQVLYLTSNEFIGGVPASVSKMMSLRLLFLDGNDFSGDIAELLQYLQVLPQLAQINLDFNDFTGSLPDDLTFKVLQLLSVGHNAISGALPPSITALPQLCVLDLNSNNMTGALPDLSAFPSSLFSLDLAYNQFTGLLPAAIGQLSGLTTMVFGNNDFDGEIPESWSALTALQFFDVSFNRKLNGPLPEWIGKLAQCQYLDLESTAISGPIPNSLYDMVGLTNLRLLNMKLSGTVSPKLASLTNIQELDLTNNSFTGTIPDAFGGLDSLTELRLAYNAFKGTIPPSMAKLQLQTVDLTGNAFSGSPDDAAGTAVNLQEFLIGGNNFTGGMPAKLRLASGLVSLDISGNPLNTSLDGNYFETLTGLVSLVMGHCQLFGSLPVSICNLTGLQIFDVAHNSMTGMLPQCMETLINLQFLSISCQGAEDLLPYELCPAPFELGSSTQNGSLASLIRAIPSLGIVDVVPNPADNLVGHSSQPPSIIPEYPVTAFDYQIAMAAIVTAVLLVVTFLFGFSQRYGTFARLDGVLGTKQLGFSVEKVKPAQGCEDHLDFKAFNKESKDVVGGQLTVVKVCAVMFFVVYTMTTYSMDGFILQKSTEAVVAPIPDSAFNFSLRLRRGDTDTSTVKYIQIQAVDDGWLQDGLKFRGYSDVVDLTQPAADGSYSFPLGFDAETQTRTIDVYVKQNDLREAGFVWELTSGSVATGRQGPIPSGNARVSGGVWAVPHKGLTCVKWDAVGYTNPYNNEWVDVSQGCTRYDQKPQLLIPARDGQETEMAPLLTYCLENMSVYVSAIPVQQNTKYDVLAGTSNFERRTFPMALRGTTYAIKTVLPYGIEGLDPGNPYGDQSPAPRGAPAATVAALPVGGMRRRTVVPGPPAAVKYLYHPTGTSPIVVEALHPRTADRPTPFTVAYDQEDYGHPPCPGRNDLAATVQGFEGIYCAPTCSPATPCVPPAGVGAVAECSITSTIGLEFCALSCDPGKPNQCPGRSVCVGSTDPSNAGQALCLWQPCASEVGDAKLTLVLQRNLFGVRETIERTTPLTTELPSLLASCGAIGGVFVSLYGLYLVYKAGKKKKGSAGTDDDLNEAVLDVGGGQSIYEGDSEDGRALATIAGSSPAVRGSSVHVLSRGLSINSEPAGAADPLLAAGK